jgi:hypothetical protein
LHDGAHREAAGSDDAVGAELLDQAASGCFGAPPSASEAKSMTPSFGSRDQRENIGRATGGRADLALDGTASDCQSDAGFWPAAFDFVGDGECRVEMAAAAAGGDENVRPGWQFWPLVNQGTHDATESILELTPRCEWIPELNQIDFEAGRILSPKDDHAIRREILAIVLVPRQMALLQAVVMVGDEPAPANRHDLVAAQHLMQRAIALGREIVAENQGRSRPWMPVASDDELRVVSAEERGI